MIVHEDHFTSTYWDEDLYSWVTINGECWLHVSGMNCGQCGPNRRAVTVLQGFTPSEVVKLPAPEWLLPGLLTCQSRGLLVSRAGTGKSFLALDWAAGLAYNGKRVLFLALEGLYTQMERLTAWCKHHGIAPESLDGSLTFNPLEAPNLSVMDEDSVSWWLQWIEATGPYDLVVVDNLNRAGFNDENSPKEAAAVVSCMDEILKRTGVVLAIHNKGWTADRMRGHTKLFDGMDTVMNLKVDGDTLELTCDKQKRAKPFDPSYYQLKEIYGTDSCVVIPAAKPGGGGKPDEVWDFFSTCTGEWLTAEDIWDDMEQPDDISKKAIAARLTKYVRNGVALKQRRLVPGVNASRCPFEYTPVLIPS